MILRNGNWVEEAVEMNRDGEPNYVYIYNMYRDNLVGACISGLQNRAANGNCS